MNLGPFVHDGDPILGQVGGFYLWWYGLGYTLGFLEIHLFLMRRRARLALSPRQVYTLTLFIVMGVLVGGRFIEVAFDEWPFYRHHPSLIPAYWLGGMATHGLLLGAALAAAAFAVTHRKSFLAIADELVIPGAILMGLGRIGNFIDGQIVGAVSDVLYKIPDFSAKRGCLSCNYGPGSSIAHDHNMMGMVSQGIYPHGPQTFFDVRPKSMKPVDK